MTTKQCTTIVIDESTIHPSIQTSQLGLIEHVASYKAKRNDKVYATHSIHHMYFQTLAIPREK